MSLSIYTYSNPYEINNEPYWDSIRNYAHFCVSERKKKLINYLIVEQKLNNDILLDFDVIKKIELISDYYGNATPKHVGIITAHIENMESYKELKKLKNEEDEKEVENIRNCYNSFLDEYFSDNNQRTILNKLLEGLKLTFINS